jgi:riboflavin kinase/FMN adenylyltransferase
MQIIRDIKNLSLKPQIISLTIGNFDGVHVGHQFLLNELTRTAKYNKGQSVVVSFENHPKSILNPLVQSNLICTLTHKIKLLELAGVDILLLLPFTKELMQQTAEYFLRTIYKLIPFKELILGHDAVFGNNREGNQENIKEIAKSLNINVRYLEPFKIGNIPVSSTLIRSYITEGNLQALEGCLGRKYAFYGKLESLAIKCDLRGLCLPPPGVYEVLIETDNLQQKTSVTIENSTSHLEIPFSSAEKSFNNNYVNIALLQ